MLAQKRSSNNFIPFAKKLSFLVGMTKADISAEMDDLRESIVGAEAHAHELRSQYSRLEERFQEMERVDKYNAAWYPAIRAAICNWVEDYVFVSGCKFAPTIMESYSSVIVEGDVAHSLALSQGPLLFNVKFAADIKLTRQRFYQAALPGSDQVHKLFFAISLRGPVPDGSRGPIMVVRISTSEKIDYETSTISLSVEAPFEVVTFPDRPATDRAVRHFIDAIFLSPRTRYGLLERIWALASFAAPGMPKEVDERIRKFRRSFIDTALLPYDGTLLMVGSHELVMLRMDHVGNPVSTD